LQQGGGDEVPGVPEQGQVPGFPEQGFPRRKDSELEKVCKEA
jgi:hypothetical protein